MIKRDLLTECGFFDENFLVCEDYDLWLKILIKEEIGYTDLPLAIKNGGHKDQLSTKFVAMDYWRIKSLLNLFKNNKNSLVCEKQENIQDLIKEVIKRKSDILLPNFLKHHNQNAYNEITEAIKLVFGK
jgi:GT2 family glycosyltransferase